MTDFASYLDSLHAAARAASAAEIEHQKQAAARAAELRDQRAFAWRRLNLMRSLADAVRDAENAEAAASAGRAALLGLVGWNGATQTQRDVADRFAPVVQAVWAATRAGESETDVAAALARFEDWYAAERGAPFLALMERETVELPLVEV